MVKLVPERLRRRPDRSDPVSPAYVGAATVFQRRLAVTAIVAVIALVAVSAGLALAQYRHAQRTNVRDLRSRATVAAAVVNAAFAGNVATLEAMANAPAFVNLDLGAMTAYLRRMGGPSSRAFNGGMGWVDPNGFVDVSSTAGELVAADGRARPGVLQARGRDRPAVRERRSRRPPPPRARHRRGRADPHGERTAHGRPRGEHPPQARSRLEGAARPRVRRARDRRPQRQGAPLRASRRSGTAALLARLGRGASGSIASTRGLDGSPGRVVAYATAAVPAWRIVIDRSRSSVDAAAFRSLILELASVAAVALLVFALVAYVVRRSRRDAELQESRARAWSELTRALAAAATADGVASALLASLSAAFPDSLVVVVLDGIDGSRETRASSDPAWPGITANAALMDELARRATSERQTVTLDRDPALRAAVARSGRRLRCLDAAPLVGADGKVIGGIALVRGSEDPLEPGERALFESFVEQTASAFERARRSELDHDLAVRLQLSLLPEALPDVPGVALAGHYSAGAEGLVVGGDWYDAIRRRDGVLVLCVGDVIGRGIGAATLMGRLRDAFRAHAYETASPAEVVRRMLQHGSRDEMMVTLACASLDPYAGELVYSCAGHPPPLLVDELLGTVTRLDRAVSPPLGVADAASIQEERVAVPARATLAFYTDGLIERRGESIDHGIDTLGAVVAADPDRPIALMLADVTDVLGPGDDDIAFLLARVAGAPAAVDVELPALPSELTRLRRRLRRWLERRGLDPAEADDILLALSEALNNSIEHAYGDEHGSMWLRIDDDGETIRASVRDRGRWRTGGSDQDRGRGTEIMRAVMDRAEIETGEDGTEVVLERRRRGSPERAAV